MKTDTESLDRDKWTDRQTVKDRQVWQRFALTETEIKTGRQKDRGQSGERETNIHQDTERKTEKEIKIQREGK